MKPKIFVLYKKILNENWGEFFSSWQVMSTAFCTSQIHPSLSNDGQRGCVWREITENQHGFRAGRKDDEININAAASGWERRVGEKNRNYKLTEYKQLLR